MTVTETRPTPKPPQRLPSVTTVLSLLAKDGLPWAAARETAQYAVWHLDDWVNMTVDDAVEKLRKHHRGIWDHRAALGTVMHTVNETWARGETPNLAMIVDQVRVGTRAWDNRTVASIHEEVAVMQTGLTDAWKQLDPVTISAEDVVRFPHPFLGYIGQSDWRANIAGKTWLIDLKTTAECDPTKALYYDSWRLQLAAYRYCTEKVTYTVERVHRPYAKGIEETGTQPLEPVDGTAVLHLRANGKWEFIPVNATETEHRHFLALRGLHHWLKTEGVRP